jgi:DMSO/TMAO reductase YedYZ molybdopterin-dependent catalytic subunit
LDPQRWSITVDGLVTKARTWTWDDAHRLPASEFHGDIHCVTTWSKLGTSFGGVSVDTLFDAARPLPKASFVLATSTTGYATNPPLADSDRRQGVGRGRTRASRCRSTTVARSACSFRICTSGRREMGHWLTLLDHDQQGFWERNGYHDRGDPWLEQRYQGD